MPNIIRLQNIQIETPSVKWEKDDFHGGAQQVVTIKFKVPDLAMAYQSELAAQKFVDGLANVTIELLGPSFYMPNVDPETGEVSESI